MLNAEEKRYYEILDMLSDIGMEEANIRIAEEYLEDGDESRLSRVQKKDLAAMAEEQKTACQNFMVKIARKNGELQQRFMHFMFAVGEQSLGSVLPYEMMGWNYSKLTDTRLSDYLPPAKALAALVGSKAGFFGGVTYTLVHIFNHMGMEPKDEDVLREALSYCDIGSSDARIMLSFACLLAARENRGCFSAEEEKTLEELRQECFMNIHVIFGLGENSPESQLLKEYIAQSPHAFRPKEEKKKAKGSGLLSGVKQWMQRTAQTEADGREIPRNVKEVLERSDLNFYFLALLAAYPVNFCREYAGFDNLIRACFYQDPQRMLEAVWNNAYSDKLSVFMQAREIGKKSDQDLLRWGVRHEGSEYQPVLAEVLKENKKAFCQILDVANVVWMKRMMQVIQEEDPLWYRELTEGPDSYYNQKLQKEIRESLLSEIEYRYSQDAKEAVKQYMDGEAELSALYPFYPKDNHVSCHTRDLIIAAQNYVLKAGNDAFMRKVNTVITIFGAEWYFERFTDSDFPKQIFNDLIMGISDMGLDAEYILGLFDMLQDSYRDIVKKKSLAAAKNYLRQEMPNQHDRLLALLQNGSVSLRYIAVSYFCEERREGRADSLAELSLFFEDNSKLVKQEMIDSFGVLSECQDFIREQLASRKLARRQMAVSLIEKNQDTHFRAELEQLLAKEKNQKLIKQTRGLLGLAEEEKTPGDGQEKPLAAEELVARLHKGKRSRSLEWLFATAFSPVHQKDGELADEPFLQAVLLCYSTMSTPGMNAEAEILTELLNEDELAVFAQEVFDKWMEDGAKTKQKWILYFSAIHGGAAMAEKLKRQINEWPKNLRGALAAEAVKALALSPAPGALMTVDGISRKFKFKQVKTAAGQAMEFAAKEMGITMEELSDRIVPSLGFDAKREQIFDYGRRKFRVELNHQLELSIYDSEGKRLKNMPAPGKRDDEVQAAKANKAFKEMKKQLKTVVASQRLRLEQALSAERKWSREAWVKLFVQNPIMHCFAIGLIWGIYEGNRLQLSFRYMEDGTFNTSDEEELELPENAVIGLVHPSELEDGLIQAWKEQLSDYEVTQPFEQLDRTVYFYEPEEAGQYAITRFEGKLINGLSLLGKMTNFGWYKGSVQDGGYYYSFYREDKNLGLGALLSFEGLSVGWENNEETVIGKLVFYQAGTVDHGSYDNETVEKLNGVKIEELPRRYFSEVMNQVSKALAGAKE